MWGVIESSRMYLGGKIVRTLADALTEGISLSRNNGMLSVS